MSRTFTYHTDPGHGWLEVSLNDLEDLGIRNTISHYSYRSGSTAYLEEDCDMPLFLREYSKKYGCNPVIEDKFTNKDSFVRNLRGYY